MPAHLRSLELQGYKTFANRTQFDFSDQVTAIVGPNGSGKSNIADSLRWVLGEQSYSLLRGKKTEDMIFAGSEFRPRAGMASATITFDNQDNWLPIDYTEVAITRRAYRDGTNEYLINGQRVRLRDVSELLAQSGLAERTYTIIGQGLVDAVLALRAEDRRRLFEEAAGIGLYRSRREEALRRLETTRRNLERVEDILAELEPRLRSLERQARRTQEYEQLKADLQVLLRDWYGYHWHRAQQELMEARRSEKEQSANLEKARQQELKLDEQVTGLRQKIQVQRQQLGQWLQELARIQVERETARRELAVSEERARSLESQLHNLHDEQTRLDDEIGLQDELIDSSSQEIIRLQDMFDEARRMVTEAHTALEQRQLERATVESRIQERRQHLTDLNNTLGQMEARLSERLSQAERGQKTLEENLATLNKALQDQERMVEDEKIARQALQKAEADSQRASDELHNHQQKLVDCVHTQKQVDEAIARAVADIERMSARHEVLEQAEAAFSGYADGARVLLQAIRQERIAGKQGALNQYLDVLPEYEGAISAALGEFLDAVILETDIENALALLATESGRAALLPLHEIRLDEIITPDDFGINYTSAVSAGFIDNANGLVQTTGVLRQVVNRLLGTVWIVKDRFSARQLLQMIEQGAHQPEHLSSLRLVTLAGEIFLSGGPVIAGYDPRAEQGQSLLGRQRQRKEIEEKTEQARADLDKINLQRSELETVYARLLVENDRRQIEERAARQKVEGARLVLQQEQLALRQSERQVQWHRDQRNLLQDQVEIAEKEIERIRNGLVMLASQVETDREQLRTDNHALAALLLDEFQYQVAQWETHLAVAERGLADENRRMEERKQAKERSIRLKASINHRMDDLIAGQTALEEQKRSMFDEEAVFSRALVDIQERIEPGNSQVQTLEIEQARLEELLAAARQSVSLADHHHAQTRIVLARAQENLSSLQRRIEEDFGLVAFEYAEQVSGQSPLPFDGMVEQLPRVFKLSPEIDEAIKRQRAQMRRIGPINPEALAEYQAVQERYTFMQEQVNDLKQAEMDIHEVIHELDVLMQQNFSKTFNAVAAEFKTIFQRLFDGGSARLVLTEPDNITDTGIDIEARLPGRRNQGLSLLSGGERSLTATSLVFALMKVSPTPFCVLDEVDAMLDEANVGRFRELLRELSQQTQFVIVTHNRNTVQAAEVIYGVTMGKDSASQVVSLKMDQIQQVLE